MRRVLGFLLVVGLGTGLALAIGKIPEALAHVEFFQVEAVTVEGARFLPHDEAVRVAAIPTGASVWDDMDPYAVRLRTHPLVDEARVRRKLPATLVVEIVERTPVALVPTPTLTPVDAEGRLLPIDPAFHRLDLPLIQPFREPASEKISLTPVEVRILARELQLMSELDPKLLASISDLALGAWGGVLLRIGEPRITLHYRPPLTPRRLRDGLVVLTDAIERNPGRRPAAIDLRFEDQVVVRFSHPNGR